MTTETDTITRSSSPTSTTENNNNNNNNSNNNNIVDNIDKMVLGNKLSYRSADKMSYRKTTKPMMEKKRRERINHCLSQLKSLVLQAMKKDNSQYSKLEKADILELTVKHLKHVQRATTNSTTSQIPTEAFNKYQAGFNECANEVIRYLGETQGLNNDARTRILSHLSTILSPVNSLPLQPTSSAQILPTSTQMLPGQAPILPAPTSSTQRLHNLNFQLQNDNKTDSLSILRQKQQELFQDSNQITMSSFQNEPQQYLTRHQPFQQQQQQQQQQTCPVANHLIRSNTMVLPIPDSNNNRVVYNVNNNSSRMPNRNFANASDALSDYSNQGLSIPISLSNSITSVSNTSQQHLTLINSNPDHGLKPLSTTTGLAPPPSFLAPSTSIPTSSTSPFQLVQSTLPNGQIALVLAPAPNQQIVPSVIYPTHPSVLTSREIASMSINENKNQPSAPLLTSTTPRRSSIDQDRLEKHGSPSSPHSGNNHNLYQESPLSLIVNKTPDISSLNNSSNASRPNVTEDHCVLKHGQISAFYQPDSSSPLPNSSSSSSHTVQPLSSSSSYVTKVANSNSATVCHSHQDHPKGQKQQELTNPRSMSSASPPKMKYLSINDNDNITIDSSSSSYSARHSNISQYKSRNVINSPEDVTSKRDMLEYKLDKSRSQSRSQSDFVHETKNTWRPW